jgi:hypothetical protein
MLTPCAVAAFAQDIPENDLPENDLPENDLPAGKIALKAELTKTGLFLISGGGCSSLLRLSAQSSRMASFLVTTKRFSIKRIRCVR